MAKRRRKKPNIPQSAMEHALQEANGDETSDQPEAVQEALKTSETKATTDDKPRRRRRTVQSAKLEKRKSEGALDSEYVAEMLANPTKIVTEEELHEDYSYVIRDLRNMGMLAAVLFVVLIGISVVIL